MARREHQLPNVLRQDGPRPYWYIRYRVRVLVTRNEIRREEKWNRLGYCDEMGKRQAERRRDEIMKGINNQLYTIQTQMPLVDFASKYRQLHVETLAPGPRKKHHSMLDIHILPALGQLRLCDIGTEGLQAFINTKEREGLAWWTRNDLKGFFRESTRRPLYGVTGTRTTRQGESCSDGRSLRRPRGFRPTSKR